MSTVSKPKMSDFQTASTQPTTEALVQDLFNKQKAYFATDVTKTYEWRVDQLNRSLTHAKSILISPPDVAIDHLFPPYTKEKVQALNQWFDY
jgi:hypothetical protein